MKMSSSPAQEQISSERRNRPRRAEREIYRPGALRQLKEISVSQTRSPVSEKLKNDTILKKNNEFDDLNSNIIIKPNISQAASEATKEISSSGLNCKQGSQSSVNSQSVNIKCGSYDKRKKERPSLNSNSHFSVSKQSECILPKKLDFGNDGNSNFPHKLEYKRSKKSFADLDSYRSKHSPDKTKKNNKPFNNHSKAKFSGNEAGGQKRDAKTNKFNERPKIDSSKLNLNERGQAKVKTKEELGKQEKPTDASSSQTPMKIVETRKSNNNVCGNKSGSSQNKNENNSKLVEKSDTGNKLEPNKMDLFNYNKKRGGGRSRNNSNHRHYEVSKRNKEHKKCEVVPKDKNVEGSKPSEKSNNINFPPKSSTGNKQVKASSIGCKGESKSDLKAETSIGSKEADPVSQSEIIRYIENIDLGPSSEETTSENEDYGNGRYQKAVNPMIYIDFEATSFYESSHDSKYIANKKNLKTSPHSQNVAWADEKWSPAQRQRKKKGKNNKESSHAESPGRRGIIQINNSPSNYETQSETVTTGQRLLFNPNNPSKPVAVMPSARDLHPSRDHPHGASDKDKNLEEAPAGPSWNESNTDTEGTGSLDPSIFYSIQKGEFDINYFVNSNQLPQEFRRIMDIRLHLQGCYKQLLISDIRLCQEKNVEGALWKSLYYIIIEKLREYIGREPTLKERSLSTLMMIVEEGLGYLQSLLTAIQKAYRFSLEAHFEEDLTTLPGTKNRVRHALYSCQKILLSMGDLARYGEQYNSSPNYLHAKKWYEMALQVNPRNGRPFNQLAIIAVSQKRSLDVVYYYIRSLTASNPFTSARDSLISMFDDIRRKYESMNINKHSSDTDSKHQNPRPEEHQSRRRDGNLRQEIWIRPDSGATNKRTLSQSDPEEEKKSRIEELLRMPQDQLMKQFLTSYLHCHGMLFSRVGLDRFGAVLGETLNLFQALLQLLHPKLSPTHLLQIMAINMYAVDNTQLRDARLESGYRSAAQDLALLLSQEMFSRLTEVMVKLFPASLNYTPKDSAWNPSSPKDEASASSGSLGSLGVESQRLFQTPLTHFVPAAKVWCDWLLYQSSVWNPPPISHDFSGVDTWGVIGELATIVKGIGPPDVTLTEDGPSHFVTPVTLPEDVFLRGYTPIVSAQMGGHYAPRNVNKERAQDWVRVKKFQLCLSQFLCGVEPPVLRLQKTDQGEILVSIVTVSPPDSPTVARSSIGSCEVDFEDSNSEVEGSNSDDDGDLGAAVDVGGDDTPLASTVRLLARRKKILEKRQRQQRKMQAILEGAVTLEMEVKPRYLVPDTNCFIEKLSIIKALIDNTNYTFMVPLIVLAELDGLSRDAAVEKYGDATHAVNVREGAATALLYIQSNKNPRLKCVTSQGSVAPANMFSLEMDTLKDITNDDKILSCCLHLCSDTNKRRPIKEGVRRLYREVVLLTEDRNLRVKAYARDVPVRELSDFAHWAGVK